MVKKTTSKKTTQTLIRLAKDPRVQRAVLTLAPMVIGLLKSRKKSKKR